MIDQILQHWRLTGTLLPSEQEWLINEVDRLNALVKLTPPPRTYEQGAEDSRDTAFLQGYVSAVANLINLRDEPTIAAEVLAQFGSIDWSKIVEEDKEALVKGGVLRALPTQPEGEGE